MASFLSQGHYCFGSDKLPCHTEGVSRMLTTAWFWIRVLDLVLGSAAVWLGLSLMQGDDRSGLKFVSVGAGMIILCLAGTFWHL